MEIVFQTTYIDKYLKRTETFETLIKKEDDGSISWN